MTTTTDKNANRSLMLIAAVIVAGVLSWVVLTMPDQRTAGEKIGDAVDALPQGLDKAARQLEDRSPGEKLGDAVKDAGQEIKKSTNR